MMKRNSRFLFLESPGATTPIPWVNNAPAFAGFTEPTLSVLQSSWQNFLDGGQDLEIIPDPEPPDPEPTPPDWTGFNSSFLTEQNWGTIRTLLLDDLRYGIVSTAANGNAPGLQAAVNMAKDYLTAQGQPLTDEIRAAWQAIADAHAIPVIF